jgi:hypothetical protein
MDFGMHAAIAVAMLFPQGTESLVTVRVLRPGSQIQALSLLPPPRRKLRRRIDILSVAVCFWLAMFVGFGLLVVSAMRAVL